MATCWIGFDEYGLEGVDEEFIRFVFNVAVTLVPFDEDVEVGLVLCKDDYIQDLNKKYRQKDYVPNVLAFAYGEMEANDFQGDDPNYLGDVFISKTKVREGAKDAEVSVKEEFARLFVHGLLHLKGMDHETEGKASKMEALEDKILAQVFS